MALYLGSEKKTIGKYIENSNVSNVTATANDVLFPKVFIDANGVEYTGRIYTKTEEDVVISENVATIPAGYYAAPFNINVGTDVGTCTVIIDGKDNIYFANIGYLQCDSNGVTPKYITYHPAIDGLITSITLENVMTNSLIFIACYEQVMLPYCSAEGGEFLRPSIDKSTDSIVVIKITANNGATAIFSLDHNIEPPEPT